MKLKCDQTAPLSSPLFLTTISTSNESISWGDSSPRTMVSVTSFPICNDSERNQRKREHADERIENGHSETMLGNVNGVATRASTNLTPVMVIRTANTNCMKPNDSSANSGIMSIRNNSVYNNNNQDSNSITTTESSVLSQTKNNNSSEVTFGSYHETNLKTYGASLGGSIYNTNNHHKEARGFNDSQEISNLELHPNHILYGNLNSNVLIQSSLPASSTEISFNQSFDDEIISDIYPGENDCTMFDINNNEGDSPIFDRSSSASRSTRRLQQSSPSSRLRTCSSNSSIHQYSAAYFDSNTELNEIMKNFNLPEFENLLTKANEVLPEISDGLKTFFTQFLDLLSKKIKEKRYLEKAMEEKIENYDKQIWRIYEDTEQQLQFERSKLLQKFEEEGNSKNLELRETIKVKQDEIEGLLQRSVELEDKISCLEMQETERRNSNKKLQEEKQLLLKNLDESKKVQEKLNKDLKNLHKRITKSRDLKNKSPTERLIVENLKAERGELCKQLELLKKYNQKLMDDKDEMEAKNLNISNQLSPFRLKKHGSIMADYFVDPNKDNNVEESSSNKSRAMFKASLRHSVDYNQNLMKTLASSVNLFKSYSTVDSIPRSAISTEKLKQLSSSVGYWRWLIKNPTYLNSPNCIDLVKESEESIQSSTAVENNFLRDFPQDLDTVKIVNNNQQLTSTADVTTCSTNNNIQTVTVDKNPLKSVTDIFGGLGMFEREGNYYLTCLPTAVTNENGGLVSHNKDEKNGKFAPHQLVQSAWDILASPCRPGSHNLNSFPRDNNYHSSFTSTVSYPSLCSPKSGGGGDNSLSTLDEFMKFLSPTFPTHQQQQQKWLPSYLDDSLLNLAGKWPLSSLIPPYWKSPPLDTSSPREGSSRDGKESLSMNIYEEDDDDDESVTVKKRSITDSSSKSNQDLVIEEIEKDTEKTNSTTTGPINSNKLMEQNSSKRGCRSDNNFKTTDPEQRHSLYEIVESSQLLPHYSSKLYGTTNSRTQIKNSNSDSSKEALKNTEQQLNIPITYMKLLTSSSNQTDSEKDDVISPSNILCPLSVTQRQTTKVSNSSSVSAVTHGKLNVVRREDTTASPLPICYSPQTIKKKSSKLSDMYARSIRRNTLNGLTNKKSNRIYPSIPFKRSVSDLSSNSRNMLQQHPQVLEIQRYPIPISNYTRYRRTIKTTYVDGADTTKVYDRLGGENSPPSPFPRRNDESSDSSNKKSLSSDEYLYGDRDDSNGCNSSTPSTAIRKLTSPPELRTKLLVRKTSTLRDPGRVFKVILLGDMGVGKSTFIHMACHQQFCESFLPTLGMDFQVKSVELDEQSVALQIWDTAGQERFKTLTRHYYRKADAILLMYDITQPKTLLNLRCWINEIKKHLKCFTNEPNCCTLLYRSYMNDLSLLMEQNIHNPVFIIIANKMDLIKLKDLKSSSDELYLLNQSRTLANDIDALHFDVSAKTGLNIEQAFVHLTRLLCNNEDLLLNTPQISAITLDHLLKRDDTTKPRKCSSCNIK